MCVSANFGSNSHLCRKGRAYTSRCAVAVALVALVDASGRWLLCWIYMQTSLGMSNLLNRHSCLCVSWSLDGKVCVNHKGSSFFSSLAKLANTFGGEWFFVKPQFEAGQPRTKKFEHSYL